MMKSNRIKKTKGLTLIEMIIVVAILGIIGAVAFPAYDRYKRKGNRIDAIDYLTKAAAFQENWMAEHGTYTTDKTKLGGNTTERNLYNITVSGGTSYTITATATGGQAKDSDCVSFSIDSIGRKKSLDSDSDDSSAKCWGR
jgi:type IV pilus assembly protein PilE